MDMLILYLAVLVTALYWVSRNLLPELLNLSSPQKAPEIKAPSSSDYETESGIKKLEALLAEKNKKRVEAG